jgi:hypothetical protein
MKPQFFDEQFDLAGKSASAWALNARRLKRSGDIVFDAYERDVGKMSNGTSLLELDNLEIASCAMLLYGLSLENLIKAVIIKGKPELISNGELLKWPGGGKHGHNLIGLFEEAVIDFSNGQSDIVVRLASFVLWAGRYPIPMKSIKMAIPQINVLRGEFLPLPLTTEERTIFDDLYQSLESKLI